MMMAIATMATVMETMVTGEMADTIPGMGMKVTGAGTEPDVGVVKYGCLVPATLGGSPTGR